MDREKLRAEVLSGIDTLLSHPLFLTAERIRLLHAQREMFLNDDDVADKLLAHYQREPTTQSGR